MKDKYIEILKTVAIVITLLAVFGLVGTEDYKDNVRDQEHYCDMVKHGRWPAFRDDILCR